MAESILITGASGFIGRHLVSLLQHPPYLPVLALRDPDTETTQASSLTVRKFDLSQDEAQYPGLFDDIDVVIHLAGIAHTDAVSPAEYQRTNVEGSRRLARQAQLSGVRRLIFLSTVKVHGESTPGTNSFFSEHSPYAPRDDYSQSKLDAENAIKQICAEGDMEYVIVRTPLVYGPGVKANFLKLIKLVSRNVPLPFSGLTNLRSFLYVENLCDLLLKTISLPTCKNQSYLVKDSDLSSPELIKKLSAAIGLQARLFYLPPVLLRSLAGIAMQSSGLERLTGSLMRLVAPP